MSDMIASADAGGYFADPSMQQKHSRRGRYAMKWVVILITIALVAIYLAVVLLNEDLRRDYFIQRLTIPILALAFTVIIFSAFRNVAAIQFPAVVSGVSLPPNTGTIVVTLAGAAAFYFLLLRPITTILFPPDQQVSGYVFYKVTNANDGLVPVRDVEVRVPETFQRSAATGKDGWFVITHLSFRPKSLDAIFENVVYPFEPRDPQGRYPIIPRPASAGESQKVEIGASEWAELGNKCTNSNTRGYSRLTLLMLHKSIPNAPGYGQLTLKLMAQSPVEIVDAQKDLPQNAGVADTLTEDRKAARQWSIPTQGNTTEVQLTVCLGTKRGGAPARNSVSANYWFR